MHKPKNVKRACNVLHGKRPHLALLCFFVSLISLRHVTLNYERIFELFKEYLFTFKKGANNSGGHAVLPKHAAIRESSSLVSFCITLW